MPIASRLSIFLPCCLLLFSIPASAGDPVVRKKPGRTTYSKTASGVTDGNEDDIVTAYSHVNSRGQTYYGIGDDGNGDDIVTAYSHTNSRGQAYYGIGDDGNGDDIVTAYSHTNSRGQTYYEDSGPDDSRGGPVVRNEPGPYSVPWIMPLGPDGYYLSQQGDVGPVAIEYAMMASLMGYSDSEAIEYGIIVALIHARTGRTDSDSAATSCRCSSDQHGGLIPRMVDKSDLVRSDDGSGNDADGYGRHKCCCRPHESCGGMSLMEAPEWDQSLVP